MTISFSKEETEQDFLESLIEDLDQYRKSLYGHQCGLIIKPCLNMLKHKVEIFDT